MRVLRAADYKVMPWKNGLGSTTEIAISSGRNDLADFDWRVSMAQVTTDGPFSSFPGIDRTLLVLEGEGIILSVAGHKPAQLDRDAIHSFPGDQSTSATLTNGPITDLNIMTRRDCMKHHARRVKVMSALPFTARQPTLLFVEHGVVTITSDTRVDVLKKYDALLIDSPISALMLSAETFADVIAIEFQEFR